MRKLVATVAAGIMVAGGAALAAPTAAAYPAGEHPAIRIIGNSNLDGGQLSGVRAFNFTPGCDAKMTITRQNQSSVLMVRTRTVRTDRTVRFAFTAPQRSGRYIVRVRQVREVGTCAGFSDTTHFTVK
jgi:hypothetical protein